MQKYLKITGYQRYSLRTVKLQETTNEVFDPGSQMGDSTFTIFLIFVVLYQLCLCLTPPWKLLVRGYEVEEDSKSKRISFGGINVVVDGLNGHVERTSN